MDKENSTNGWMMWISPWRKELVLRGIHYLNVVRCSILVGNYDPHTSTYYLNNENGHLMYQITFPSENIASIYDHLIGGWQKRLS